MGSTSSSSHREPWNKGKIVGQKAPFKIKDIWAFGCGCKWKAGRANPHSSTLASTADSPHLGTRQYARILEKWVEEMGLDPAAYGTHSMRRTKATLIYRRTKNLRAVQLLLGHSKLESTVRYLGIEVDDALEISEQTEI
jgi:site-specific recombinase XerD